MAMSAISRTVSFFMFSPLAAPPRLICLVKEAKHQGLIKVNFTSIAHLKTLCYTNLMKKYIKKFFDNEILSYLFFGVATTIVSVGTRMLIFYLTRQELTATALGNITGILFAFFTNDTIVFKQKREKWFGRLLKFSGARLFTFLLDMGLTFIFVTKYPHIIGQFVGDDINIINTIEIGIAQVTIVVLNYLFSKLFVFKNH